MKVYNQDKTILLEEYNIDKLDLDKGYLKEDTLITHYDEVQAVEEQWHYETIAEYENGGKEIEKVIDVEGAEYQPARDEEEKILVYIPYTEKELLENKKNDLREKREYECFSIINRGKLWYDTLTSEQIEELNEWYRAWLDVTTTLVEPKRPEWIK